MTTTPVPAVNYREDFGRENNDWLTVRVSVRVDSVHGEVVGEFSTVELSPMGVWQHEVARRFGVPLCRVSPVTWCVLSGAVCMVSEEGS